MKISVERLADLTSFQELLGYKYNSIEWLNKALTHKSYVNENKTKFETKDNERLEFLGDAVLDLVISEYIFNKYSDYREGELAKIRSGIVSSKSLHSKAKHFSIGKYILFGKGEENSGGRKRFSNLTNAFEAVIGSIFLDSNYDKVKEFLLPVFSNDISDLVAQKDYFDYKSLLQEYTQHLYKNRPVYKLISESGPEHSKKFTMEVVINNTTYGTGISATKKEAERLAASEACNKLNITPKKYQKNESE